MKILIPLDGSELAESILTYVETLARDDTQIVLMKVGVIRSIAFMTMDQSPMIYDESGDRDRITAESRQYLEGLAQGLRNRGFSVNYVVAFGDPAEVILDFAKSLKVDLIAMCTHGRSGISRLLFGSVAEAVIRRSSVPVLALSSYGKSQK